jgi:hypothetical protein
MYSAFRNVGRKYARSVKNNWGLVVHSTSCGSDVCVLVCKKAYDHAMLASFTAPALRSRHELPVPSGTGTGTVDEVTPPRYMPAALKRDGVVSLTGEIMETEALSVLSPALREGIDNHLGATRGGLMLHRSRSTLGARATRSKTTTQIIRSGERWACVGRGMASLPSASTASGRLVGTACRASTRQKAALSSERERCPRYATSPLPAPDADSHRCCGSV